MLNANFIEKLKLNISLAFGNRRKSKGSVGIRNTGKGNTFQGNVIDGFDTGIEDEGTDTKATGNRITK